MFPMVQGGVSGEIGCTMDIDKVLKERAILLDRLKKIDEFIVAYEGYTGTKIDQNDLFVSNDDLADQGYPQNTVRKKWKRKVAPALIAKLSERVIREHGEPMRRGEIVEAVEALGFEIHSTDKNRYVGTILWRNIDIFDNIEGYGYWVRKLGPPPMLPDWRDQYQEIKDALGMK